MSLTPPPLPASPGKKTFFHQAAQYSLLAPICAIGLGIVINGSITSFNASDRLLIGWITAIFNSLLILSGFIAGIVALTGIWKHGKTGILGKAIIGIVISGGFILMAIIALPAVAHAAQKAKQHQISN